MRESRPMPAITSGASAPTRSQMLAISLAKPIFIARNALAAYLIISALVSEVASSGTEIMRRRARHAGRRREDLRDQRLVEFAHDGERGGVAAHHDAVGIERIGDRASLRAGTRDCWPRRSGCASSRRALADAFAHQRFHQVAGAHRHGGFVDHHAEPRVIHGGADAAGGGFQVGQVGFAGGQRRSADGDEDDVAGAHRVGQFGGELEAAARGARAPASAPDAARRSAIRRAAGGRSWRRRYRRR